MTFMKRALDLAQKGRFTCMPNPMVGCVIVKNNIIIGHGYHVKAGEHHAEINALILAGCDAVGADVYVTLEPCSHYGRTPPCVDALIAASVKSVHVALKDPNPLVSGNGIQRLREAGIEVIIGEYSEEAYQLNKSFFYYITQKKPFVIAKWAMSLDGKIAGSQGDNWGPARWISSEESRQHAHSIRAEVGAIMVGHNTVLLDDPDLTVRYDKPDTFYFTDPRPIVLTARGNLPYDRKIFAKNRNTIVMTSCQASSQFLSMLDKNQIEYHFIAAENDFLSLPDVIDKLGTLHISRLLVEGGSQLLTQCFNYNVVNKVYAYVAPKIIGGAHSLSPIMGDIFCEDENNIRSQAVIQLGSDVCFIAETALTPKTYDDFIKRRSNV